MAIFKTLSAAAIIAVGTTAIASAAVVGSPSLIDLTDSTTYELAGATGSSTPRSSIDFTLAASGGNLTNFELLDVGTDVTPLLGTVDGVGITDDEVSQGQSLTISFANTVEISTLYFLDLFTSRAVVPEAEGVTVTSNTGQIETFFSNVEFRNGRLGFNTFDNLALTGSSFTFTPTDGNDAVGVGDFALAGLEVSIVPLPAGILLLAGALGGLGFASRRKAGRKPA